MNSSTAALVWDRLRIYYRIYLRYPLFEQPFHGSQSFQQWSLLLDDELLGKSEATWTFHVSYWNPINPINSKLKLLRYVSLILACRNKPILPNNNFPRFMSRVIIWYQPKQCTKNQGKSPQTYHTFAACFVVWSPPKLRKFTVENHPRLSQWSCTKPCGNRWQVWKPWLEEVFCEKTVWNIWKSVDIFHTWYI